MNIIKGKGMKIFSRRGEATIEGIICFTGFLFLIFTILSVVNVCKTQAAVSNALDTSAKEISQYSYLYKMSGLQKFDMDVNKNNANAKVNLNDVLSSVNSLYSSVSTGIDNTSENVTTIKNNIDDLDFDGTVTNLTETMNNVQQEGHSVASNISSIESSLEQVGNNPLMYMKCVIAVAGCKGYNLAKSRLIAAPLAKVFMKKHFGDTDEEVDANLKSMGIDGINEMNFNLSTLFAPGDDGKPSDEVCLVVCYKIKILSVIKWAQLELPVYKASSCKGWLAGDDYDSGSVTIETDDTPDETSETSTEENSDDESSEEESSEEESSEEESSEEESSEEESSTVDVDGSYWYLQETGHGGDGCSYRADAFEKKLCEDYDLDEDEDFLTYTATDTVRAAKDKIIYGFDYGIDEGTTSSLLNMETAYNTIFSEMQQYDKETAEGKEHEHGDTFKPGNMDLYRYVIYVPENISDSEYKKIEEEARLDAELLLNDFSNANMKDNKWNEYKDYIDKKPALNIVVVKGGGNFDYEKGEYDA